LGGHEPQVINPMSDAKSKAEHLANIAGAFGFLLALGLAIIQGVGYLRTQRIDLRLAQEQASEQVPFARSDGRDSDLSFALYHHGGPDLRIEVVALRLKRLASTPTRNGHIISGGFGPEGIFESDSGATRFYLFQVGDDGRIAPPEARALPFSPGGARYYIAPFKGPLELRKKLATESPDFALVEVWAQGYVVKRFNVSAYLRKRFEMIYSPARELLSPLEEQELKRPTQAVERTDTALSHGPAAHRP
jgi:hypothetical protein